MNATIRKCLQRKNNLSIQFVLKRNAMTLAEVVIALTLAVLLMTVTTTLLRSIGQPLRHAEWTDSPVWQSRLARQLQRDLSVGKTIHTHGNTIWIHGQLTSYIRPGETIAVVGYQCIVAGDSHWALIRVEPDGVELFALGVVSLVVERIDENGEPQPLPPAPGPIPDRIRLLAYGERSQETLLRRDIVLW